MEETPISDKNNLSVDSYGTGFLENFLYEIGLLLDSEIPVNGFTNSQRIEIAVNRYISQSARIRELEEALEFYANDENWRSPSKGFALQYDPVPSAISKDSGHIAKQALKEQS